MRPTQRELVAMRHCRVLVVAMWILLSTSWLACAQTVPGLPPSPESSVPAIGTESIPVSGPASQPVVVRGPCDPDYWIVSTRRSKDLIEAGQAVHYHVYRFDGPNPGRGSSMEELLASLQPGVPVCFMAHGSFVTWESMLSDSAMTYRWLRSAAPEQPVHIIFYTWASDEDGGCFPFLKVNKLGRRASLNGFYLADLVTRVSADHPICMIGHSHGTRMVTAALHCMGGGAVEGRMLSHGPQPARNIRVVLAAAAIDHHWLNPDDRFGLALHQAQAVINLRNHADLPLQLYPLRRPISAKALAITGFTRGDRWSMGEHHLKIVDHNVADLVGVGHIWMHYYNQPRIAQAIRHYVYFDESQR